MKKLVLLCVIFLFAKSLLAIPRPTFADFKACYDKNRASVMLYEGAKAFVLSPNLLAVVKSKGVKLNKYVKYDPFLNLYLIRTDFSLIPAVMGDELKLDRNDWVGIINPKKPYIGHYLYFGINLDERDQLDFASIIGQLDSTCCKMLGIALNNGKVIGNRYLKHFAKYNSVYWGDIGVDFDKRDGHIFVSRVRNSGQFLLNDELISIDNEKYEKLRRVNEKILFANLGSTLYFKVLRDNQEIPLSVQVYAKSLARFGIGVKKTKKIERPFTSNLGFVINKQFFITKIEAKGRAKKAGLKVGDKFIRVNNIPLKSLLQLEDIFKRHNEFNILLSRKAHALPTQVENQNSRFSFFIKLTR